MAGHRFPLLRCQTVCQNLFEAICFFPPVPVSCLRNPTSQPGLIGLLLQLDGITYFWCPPPGLGVAATTCTRDFMATAPDVHVDNRGREHSPLRLNVSSLPRDPVKVLKISLTGVSAKHSQQTLMVRFGLPSLYSSDSQTSASEGTMRLLPWTWKTGPALYPLQGTGGFLGVCPTSPHVFCGFGEGIRPGSSLCPVESALGIQGKGPIDKGCLISV
ncbi:uncharacterized protein LOC122351062 [Puntigrus tetrazona]|uniref:uncharacterized protein LOC122351062 n=1 Tax=Puntigrus tetrazona TaxID=1606681 RepID=UPI001C8A1553|nr:uncharacterized protein LOC122351062 [Puntigrus tetrazona]